MHIIIIAANGSKQIKGSCVFMYSWFYSQPNYITLEVSIKTRGKRKCKNCSKLQYLQVQANAMENLRSLPFPCLSSQINTELVL